eukprot:UC4_evm5s704
MPGPGITVKMSTDSNANNIREKSFRGVADKNEKKTKNKAGQSSKSRTDMIEKMKAKECMDVDLCRKAVQKIGPGGSLDAAIKLYKQLKVKEEKREKKAKLLSEKRIAAEMQQEEKYFSTTNRLLAQGEVLKNQREEIESKNIEKSLADLKAFRAAREQKEKEFLEKKAEEDAKPTWAEKQRVQNIDSHGEWREIEKFKAMVLREVAANGFPDFVHNQRTLDELDLYDEDGDRKQFRFICQELINVLTDMQELQNERHADVHELGLERSMLEAEVPSFPPALRKPESIKPANTVDPKSAAKAQLKFKKFQEKKMAQAVIEQKQRNYEVAIGLLQDHNTTVDNFESKREKKKTKITKDSSTNEVKPPICLIASQLAKEKDKKVRLEQEASILENKRLEEEKRIAEENQPQISQDSLDQLVIAFCNAKKIRLSYEPYSNIDGERNETGMAGIVEDFMDTCPEARVNMVALSFEKRRLDVVNKGENHGKVLSIDPQPVPKPGEIFPAQKPDPPSESISAPEASSTQDFEVQEIPKKTKVEDLPVSLPETPIPPPPLNLDERIKSGLKSKKLKLWIPPYTNEDGTPGEEMEKVNEEFAEMCETHIFHVIPKIEKLRVTAYNKLMAKNAEAAGDSKPEPYVSPILAALESAPKESVSMESPPSELEPQQSAEISSKSEIQDEAEPTISTENLVKAMLKNNKVRLWEPPYTEPDGITKNAITMQVFVEKFVSDNPGVDEIVASQIIEDLRVKACTKMIEKKKTAARKTNPRASSDTTPIKPRVTELLKNKKIKLWVAPYSGKNGETLPEIDILAENFAHILNAPVEDILKVLIEIQSSSYKKMAAKKLR